jgi:hypothetical protein
MACPSTDMHPLPMPKPMKNDKNCQMVWMRPLYKKHLFMPGPEKTVSIKGRLPFLFYLALSRLLIAISACISLIIPLAP